tara:strand:- start:6 stop:230 length:225 start_codon:yes stop_codon:yes gene_type:complete
MDNEQFGLPILPQSSLKKKLNGLPILKRNYLEAFSLHNNINVFLMGYKINKKKLFFEKNYNFPKRKYPRNPNSS